MNFKYKALWTLILTILILATCYSAFSGVTGGLNTVCENRSYVYDATAPMVTLINVTIINTTQQNIPVYFSYADLSKYANCSLYLNGTYNTSSTVANNTVSTITASNNYTYGHYGVTVNCSDNAQNLGNSSYLIVNVSSIPNTAPNVTLISPIEEALVKGSGVRLNFTLIDNDLNPMSYKVFASPTNGSLSFEIIKTGSGITNGTYIQAPVASYVNGTTVRWLVEVNDGTLSINSSERNYTINSVILTEPSTYFQRPSRINITGNGTWDVKMRWPIGWNYTGNITDKNYTYSKNLLSGAHNITIYQESTGNSPKVLNNSENFSFVSYNVTPSCLGNIYHIDFNINALESTGFVNQCNGLNCNLSMSINNPFDFQLKQADLVIPSSSLVHWGNRRSIDIQYTNYTVEATKVAKGDVYCLIGTGGGGLGIFGNETEYTGENQTGTNETIANSSCFSGALTDIIVTINPTITADDTGITLSGLNIGGGYNLLFDYSWSEGTSGTTGADIPIGGGGGGITEIVIIGNISVKPRSIDVPFFKFPFGKGFAEMSIEVSNIPNLCVFENPNPELKCFIDSTTGLVTIEYSPSKNVFNEVVSNRLIITSGSAQAYVPVTFRLFNFDYYIQLKIPLNFEVKYDAIRLFIHTNNINLIDGIKVFPVITLLIALLLITGVGKKLWE